MQDSRTPRLLERFWVPILGASCSNKLFVGTAWPSHLARFPEGEWRWRCRSLNAKFAMNLAQSWLNIGAKLAKSSPKLAKMLTTSASSSHSPYAIKLTIGHRNGRKRAFKIEHTRVEMGNYFTNPGTTPITILAVNSGRKLGAWSEFPFLYRFRVLLTSGGSNSPWSEFWVSSFYGDEGSRAVNLNLKRWCGVDFFQHWQTACRLGLTF